MNTQMFNALVEEQIEQIRSVLVTKVKEYVTSKDRLHNFKSAVPDKLQKTPGEACWGYMVKHLVSVRDLALGIRKGNLEMINKKIGDVINYLILLKGILVEELVIQPNPQTQGNSEGI